MTALRKTATDAFIESSPRVEPAGAVLSLVDGGLADDAVPVPSPARELQVQLERAVMDSFYRQAKPRRAGFLQRLFGR